MPEVVILGAGLTGLSTAYHLEQNNFFDFAIYEKESRAGGLMRSEHCNGFAFDYTGHYLHVNDQGFNNFLNEVYGLDSFDKVQRNSAIYTHRTTVVYPFQMNLYGLPSDVIYECLQGYLMRPRSRVQPKTFYAWVLKYFGKGLGKHFFFPYNSKLLAYPIKKIHPNWTGRFVPQTSLHDILKGALEPNPHRHVGYNTWFYYPRQGGIESFIKKLAAKVAAPIHTGYEVVAIDSNKKIITFSNGKTVSYYTLITTMPLDHMLKMLVHPSDESLRHVAQNLWCNSVINFNLGFSTGAIGPYHWIYFPEKCYHFYRLGFWHNISSSLVVPGCSSIYGELSYQPRWHSRTSMQKKVDAAIGQTLAYLGLTSSDIKTALTLEIPHGYVVYDAWREKNLSRLLIALQGMHIYSTGRFGAWKYSSMQEAYSDGKDAARAVLVKCYPKSNVHQAKVFKTTAQQV